ncbi:hypothetical protein ACFLQV_02265 [Calditrichota bacterium]
MKKLLNIALGVMLVSLTIVSGCSHNPTAPEPDELMPLAVGNYWLLDYTLSLDGVAVDKGFDTLIIKSSTFVNGLEYYGINFNDYTYYRNSDEGLEFCRVMNDRSAERFQLYKYPVEVGDSWERTGNNPGIITCISKNQTVRTNAGTFTDCILYYYINEDSTDYYNEFYKPGLGPVMFKSGIMNRPGDSYLYLLSEYHIVS